jgi:replicative DNA helicase
MSLAVMTVAGKDQVLHVEKRFLSYLFNDKKYIAMSLGKITKNHLINTYMIYSLLVGYFQHYKGIITDEIVDIMFQKKNLSVDQVVNYKTIITEVRMDSINDDAEFEAIIEELNEYRKRREYLNIAEKIIETNPIDCPTDKLDDMEKNIKDQIVSLTAEASDVRKEGTIKDSVSDRKSYYEFIKANPEAIKVIRTGFNTIDIAEGGFRPGELVYVIGRKGDGKSVLLLNIGHNAWKQGENVILFSLEISKEDYERRFDARAAGISSNGLKRGNLTEQEELAYKDYLDKLSQGLTPDGQRAGIFYVVDVPAGCTPAFIDSKVDAVEQLLGVKFGVIITDYAGIMQPNIPVEQKRHEQGQIALDLKRIARTRNSVVISAAQMSRKGREEDKADTAHVAESDQVADHIDWGIAIRSISDTTGKIESFKTRDAAPFEFHFTKRYSCMKIEELDDNLSSWDNVGGAL